VKIESVQIDGIAYEVREQPMRVLLPILEGDPKAVSRGMLEVSVYLAGMPLGNGWQDLGFVAYRSLLEAVNRVYGLAEDNSGNA
jgi:hypothetical protein